MNYLVVLNANGLDHSLLGALTPDDALTFLVPLERETLASEFESHLRKLLREAEGVQSQLKLKGVDSKIIIEWGKSEDVVASSLAREQAILLK